MYDFLRISSKNSKGDISLYPTFIVGKPSKDLMIRGRDFYAIWDEETGLWSKDEDTATQHIDNELEKKVEELRKHDSSITYTANYMWNGDNKMIDKWHHYCQKQLRDNWQMLDNKVIFANQETKREDYATHKLPYAIAEGEMPAYEELVSKLYEPQERDKFEWAIGSIIAGDAKDIQKFIVFYGDRGTGKSSIMDIIEQLFEGYTSHPRFVEVVDPNNSFALESFKDNPLVAIEHDSKLDRIADNSRLNSIVSHEKMMVNEKFKPKYETKFNCFIFIGTNTPIQITDSKSGLLRRLIDVYPTGDTFDFRHYKRLMKQIKYELGAIAYHCLEKYKKMEDSYYNSYVPDRMMSATNDIYDFIEYYYLDEFSKNDQYTLNDLWRLWRAYIEDGKVYRKISRKELGEEMKSYFNKFYENVTIDGTHYRMLYKGFKREKFEKGIDPNRIFKEAVEQAKNESWLDFKEQHSLFDDIAADYPAQYVRDNGSLYMKWADNKMTLKDINTSRVHHVKVPPNHIVIDFDIKDENGNKSFEKNLEAASKWPKTYAELSKSGGGIHLHYIYTGDPTMLMALYDEDIEIKVFTGDSSLRRKLSKCNDIPIATISSGLPLKGEKKVWNKDIVKNEKVLRSTVINCLHKKHHGHTTPEMNYIESLLEDAYNSGMPYDITDLRPAVYAFAANSTNNSKECIKQFQRLHFKSETEVDSFVSDSGETLYKIDIPEQNDGLFQFTHGKPIVFFDVEVFRNLFILCWKILGSDKVNKMINPSRLDVEKLFDLYFMVGFNNRRYDNHICYAWIQGYTNEELYRLSQRIVNSDKSERNCFFSEAYNMSGTDIYDFSSVKQSLKKFEIDLGIHHQELGMKWDILVPEKDWPKVADYCCNDVIATEAVWNDPKRQADWKARMILAELSGLTVNDTTNQHTTRLIVGEEKNPQQYFIYTDLSKIFPGYKFENGVSTYRGEEVGEGGYVYSKPGAYRNVKTYDVSGMHPSSAIALKIFGKFTDNFKDLVDARVAIKHKDYDKVRHMFGGKLAKYLTNDDDAAGLAQALKIAVNSVYGLTAASFPNKLRDPRNIDNIVAKYGALFMITLRDEVIARGGEVVHIKTDSIKVVDPTPEIEEFIYSFGRQYGFNFEVESWYERFCLVNKAVYIARNKEPKIDKKTGREIWWSATGDQFKVPFVFKTLFSHEPIEFKDLCETKSVKTAIYLDMNEDLPQLTPLEEKELEAIDNYWHYEQKAKPGEDINQKKADLSRRLFKRYGYSSDEELGARYSELCEKNEQAHNYVFVGKVGSFCPIKPGCHGGVLLREANNGYSAVTGSTGYRWLEAETVMAMDKQNDIDLSYYNSLAAAARKEISQYCDFYEFVSEPTEFDITDQTLTY